MRTRIALIAVFTVASIIAISTAVLVRPVTSQAAATAPSKSSTSTSSITNASQLVAFNSSNTSKSRPATIAGLGALLSLDAGLVAAANTATTTPVAATPAPAVVAVPVAAPAPAPVVPVSDATSTATGDWNCIRVHESGDRYNDSSAPSGAYGIISVTWHSYGYSGWPYEASPATQDALALKLYNQYGWQPWSTRNACGL
jgi:hypothetical protein